MTARNHMLFWSLAFAGFLAFVYVFKAVLLPFVLGMAIAYLLNPIVNALGRAKISRRPAALFILVIFFTVVALAFTLIAPVLYRQGIQFAEDVPGYVDSLLTLVDPYSKQILALLGEENGTDLKALAASHAGTAADIIKHLVNGVAAGSQALFDLVSVFVLTPIVAYFTMKEWVHITNWVEDLLPRENKKTILDLLKQIDQKLSGFVRGQISVAVILAIVYAVALSVAGLKYGFLIGLVSGLLSIIPMVGSAIGLVVSVTVAWFQAYDLIYVAIIGGIFLAGQIIEGNILSPKIVGKSVGMHPLWVFFALLAGGSLFGILGMLLAVPVAAVAGVLLAFAITQYKGSPYYTGMKKPKPVRKKAKPHKKPKKAVKKKTSKKKVA